MFLTQLNPGMDGGLVSVHFISVWQRQLLETDTYFQIFVIFSYFFMKV